MKVNMYPIIKVAEHYSPIHYKVISFHVESIPTFVHPLSLNVSVQPGLLIFLIYIFIGICLLWVTIFILLGDKNKHYDSTDKRDYLEDEGHSMHKVAELGDVVEHTRAAPPTRVLPEDAG